MLSMYLVTNFGTGWQVLLLSHQCCSNTIVVCVQLDLCAEEMGNNVRPSVALLGDINAVVTQVTRTRQILVFARHEKGEQLVCLWKVMMSSFFFFFSFLSASVMMAGNISLIQSGGPHWGTKLLLMQKYQRCTLTHFWKAWWHVTVLGWTNSVFFASLLLSTDACPPVNSALKLLHSVSSHFPAAATRLHHCQWGCQHYGHRTYHVEQLPATAQARHSQRSSV